MPANKVCVVDLLDTDDNMVMTNKKCILNYHDIDDPWDVDGNGILKYAQTQGTFTMSRAHFQTRFGSILETY